MKDMKEKGIRLPNAVKISPPNCLVKLTTRIAVVSMADDDVGGNTKDVGIGPPLHIGIIDTPPKWSL